MYEISIPNDTGELSPVEHMINALALADREREQAGEIRREYQKNIKLGEDLRAEILKGIKQGEDFCALLLKAIRCICAMTGNTFMYEQAREDIKAIHGSGLLKRAPLEMELQDLRQRLSLLTAAPVSDDDDAARIRAAIRAHERRIQEISAILQRLE